MRMKLIVAAVAEDDAESVKLPCAKMTAPPKLARIA